MPTVQPFSAVQVSVADDAFPCGGLHLALIYAEGAVCVKGLKTL